MTVRFFVPGLLCLTILLGCSNPPIKPEEVSLGDYQYLKQYMSWLIPKEMKRKNVKGLSLALVDDQHIVWAQGFGFSDVLNQIPVTPETIFRVASISKCFTATAVMQLSDQNKINIDLPLKTYLPEFSIKSHFSESDPITTRSIMTHHSGLPSNLLKGLISKHPRNFAQVVTEIKNDYVAYPPNYVFSYSNIGYTLLGSLIEKTSGKDFISYMKEYILDPMGMNHSYFSTTLVKSPLSARGYRSEEQFDEEPLRDLPAGGLNSSVVDLSQFIQMVFANGRTGSYQILRPETLREMLHPQNNGIPLDLDFRIGLGWMLSSFGDIDIQGVGLVAHHSGATLVFGSQLVILPEYKLGIVVLSNSDSSADLIDKVASEAIKLAFEAKTGKILPKTKPPAEQEDHISPEKIKSFEGTYATLSGVANISSNSGALKAKVNNSTFRLIPLDNGRFRLGFKLFGLIPIPLDFLGKMEFERTTILGHEILTVQYGGNELLVGEKIKPVSIPKSWLTRIGSYGIINQEEDYSLIGKIRLRYEGSFLILEYTIPFHSDAHVRLAIKPLSDTEAIIYGLGSGKGETIQVVDDKAMELLRYSGYLFQKKHEMYPENSTYY